MHTWNLVLGTYWKYFLHKEEHWVRATPDEGYGLRGAAVLSGQNSGRQGCGQNRKIAFHTGEPGRSRGGNESRVGQEAALQEGPTFKEQSQVPVTGHLQGNTKTKEYLGGRHKSRGLLPTTPLPLASHTLGEESSHSTKHLLY